MVETSLKTLGTSPTDLSLATLLQEFMRLFNETCAKSGGPLEDAVISTLRTFVDGVALKTPGKPATMMDNVMLKERVQALLVQNIPQVVEIIAARLPTILNAIFLSSHEGDLRLCRFEVLRDAVCEAATKGVLARSEGFRKAATVFVLRFFQDRIGNQFNWQGIEPRHQWAPTSTGTTGMALVSGLAECAVRELLVALPGDLSNFENFLSLPDLSAPPPVSAEKPAARARRKRARVEEKDGAQTSSSCSSSSSSSSSERTGDVDAMAVVDGAEGADERPLLVENCAADRAKLSTQKHDLVVAENDLKSL